MKKILMVFAAACITLAVTDFLLRFILNEPVYQRIWPEIPQLTRFNHNAADEKIIVGNLGALTKEAADDVPRRVKTKVDSSGFRNDEAAGWGIIDLIILGDSFGFGGGTTQEKIFASRLRDRYGFSTYNLSLPHTGPWEEYVNLALESKRLKLERGRSFCGRYSPETIWTTAMAIWTSSRYLGMTPWAGFGRPSIRSRIDRRFIEYFAGRVMNLRVVAPGRR